MEVFNVDAVSLHISDSLTITSPFLLMFPFLPDIRIGILEQLRRRLHARKIGVRIFLHLGTFHYSYSTQMTKQTVVFCFDVIRLSHHVPTFEEKSESVSARAVKCQKPQHIDIWQNIEHALLPSCCKINIFTFIVSSRTITISTPHIQPLDQLKAKRAKVGATQLQ